MFTPFSKEEAVTSAIIAGASGYLLKNIGRADLLKPIRGVADGQSLLDPSVTSKVMERLAQLSVAEERQATAGLSALEKDVLVLVARGLTNREVAEQLIITENTARNHVSRILKKLGLSRSTEAVTFAAQHGLLKDEKAKNGWWPPS